MASRRATLTITQVFALTFGGVTVVVGGLFYGLLESSRRSVVERSERFREAVAARIDARITHDLGEASGIVDDVERGVHAEIVDPRSPAAAEAPLFALLLAHPKIADISLTHPDGWQISVFRATADPNSGLATRIVRRDGEHFVADVRTRAAGAKIGDGTVSREEAKDPTAHLTYETTVSPRYYGTAIWSDLHYSQLDGALPVDERRVVVTVQKAIDDPLGKPAGVVRVGILASTIDETSAMRVEEGNDEDPHRVFLCDPEGRLRTRLAPTDRVALTASNDLRVVSTPSPEIARALASPKLREISFETPVASEAFVVNGRRYLLTLRQNGTAISGWIAGILVPEDHYTKDLRALRDRFIAIDLTGALIALLGGIFVLVSVRGGLRRLVATTSHMRNFELAPDPRPARLADVDEVVQGLERAKTAMRAMSKYVPVDLVRTLYAANREPELGGVLAHLTLMFTDIRGFTDLSERISPNELAKALGLYLEAMTTAIRATGGTIDKFIGDAVMTIWNAPTPTPNHPVLACRAALACTDATARLYASEAWKGLPALVTRFGIHTDDVLVGHFGAPSRLSYTALGDGVNLAARLEGLCKQYGVTRIVSDAVEREARAAFTFRRLDRVAVKGKSRGVLVFELLAQAGAQRGPEIDAYEAALEHYFARRFADAIASLAPFVEVDPPAKVLFDRCKAFLETPPAPDWDGTYVARSK